MLVTDNVLDQTRSLCSSAEYVDSSGCTQRDINTSPAAQGTPLTLARGIFPAVRSAPLPTEIPCLTMPFPDPRVGVGASASTQGSVQHDVYAGDISSSDDDDPEVAK